MTGRQAAFAAFVAARREQLVRAAEWILRDRNAAEDVVQETLTRLLTRDGPWPQRLTAYAFRAVRNNALKARLRQRMEMQLDEAWLATETTHDENEELDPVMLEAAIEELPAAQQAVIRMKYYTGMTFREIGNALSISMNTAASRCRYALDHLRRTLEDEADPQSRKEKCDGREKRNR